MSEAVRAVALAEANKVVGASGDANIVLKTARQFLEFLSPTNPAATRSAAGAEPEKVVESKPSASTAGDKKAADKKAAKVAAEQTAAKEALDKANEEEDADEAAGPAEAFEANKEGVSAAVAAMISNKTGNGPNRDTAIALLKKYKAASVSAMQGKDEKTLGAFINEVNEAFGLGGEPDLES